MKPEKLLEKCIELVSNDRAKQHGDWFENHQNIADLWTVYLRMHKKISKDTKIEPDNVAELIELQKIARGALGDFVLDNHIDGASYAAIAGACRYRRLKPNEPK